MKYIEYEVPLPTPSLHLPCEAKFVWMKNVETIQIQEETQRAIYYLVEREDEKWFFRSKKLPSSVRDSKKPVDRQAARYQASESM